MSDSFAIEWEPLSAESPVESHARTWGSLGIRLGDVVATRAEDREVKMVRERLHGPLMPLAEWVVSNWWYLFHESPRAHPLPAARAASAEQRDWYRRHNTLFAREGFPFADLTIARANDNQLVVKVAPDPRPIGRYPVRFIEAHERLIPAAEARQELRRFVEAVVARLEGSDARDAIELRDAWQGIQSLSGDDLTLRERAAALGLDGDDPDDVPDELAEVLVEGLSELPASLVGDLLEVPVGAGAFRDQLAWVHEARSPRVKRRPSGSKRLDDARTEVSAITAEMATEAAYQVGWRLAAEARERTLSLPETAHGAALDLELAKWVSALDVLSDDEKYLRGWVRANGAVEAVLGLADGPTTRFLTARAWCLGLLGGPERLITNAQTWTQSVCRAFATELLAPASYLRERVGGTALTEAELAKLAAELAAPRRVVEHQLENHSIAVVE